MRSGIVALVMSSLFVPCLPGSAQFPRGITSRIEKVEKVTDKLKDVELTPEEEVRLGEEISSRIRTKYGVVQDPAVHKYVSLVGTVVARKSGSTMPFHFIVLDTDGVNAFAAPGGFIHITRGALALVKDESQLAGVLAHEVAHVTQQHTIRAIQKGKVVQMAAKDRNVSSNPELFRRLTDEAYNVVFAGFGRADELDADTQGFGFAAGAGYAGGGLGMFLATLKERNGSSSQRQGLFASHPEMDERMQKLDAMVPSRSGDPGATLAERYTGNVKFQPVDLAQIAAVEAGAAGLAGETKKEEPKKKSRFSMASLRNPLGTTESSPQSAAVTGSGGSRGVDKERLAKGGPNPAPVAVTLTEAEITDFRTTGNLKA